MLEEETITKTKQVEYEETIKTRTCDYCGKEIEDGKNRAEVDYTVYLTSDRKKVWKDELGSGTNDMHIDCANELMNNKKLYPNLKLTQLVWSKKPKVKKFVSGVKRDKIDIYVTFCVLTMMLSTIGAIFSIHMATVSSKGSLWMIVLAISVFLFFICTVKLVSKAHK